MSSEDNERITLLSGTTQPRYLFHTSITQQRHRRLRQFQCCVCTIMLCALLVILVFVVFYGINQNIPEPDNPENSTQSNTETLLTLTWPLPDKKQNKICISEYSNLEDAFMAGIKALHERDEIEKNISNLDINTPSYKHQKSFLSSNRIKFFSRMGYLKENAQKYLHRYGNESSAVFCNNTHRSWEYQLYENNNRTDCNEFQKYRSFDGISKPRVAKDGSELPTARTVSLVVHRPVYKNDNKFTVMLAVWGQFMDHDITATALTQGVDEKPIACCTKNYHPECFPVQIDSDDPYYSLYNLSCLEFIRSAGVSTNYLEPRQQLNQVSSFLDGSVVYGSHVNITNNLREFKDGKLKMYVTNDNRTLLPISNDLTDGCNREEQSKLGKYCFMTGDQRANENLHLTSMHLIWARHHNYLADKLKYVNPQWKDERIFQETRRILIAQMQHITYSEFLKILIGPRLLKKTDLYPRKTGFYTKYNNSIDSSVANSFATAAFRFGHTLIPALMKFIIKNSSDSEYIQFHKMLFNPFKLYRKDGLDGSLLGAMNTTIEASDTYFNPEIKNHLFEEIRNNSNRSLRGLDLVSLNIQRGRDHGIPGYPSWRKHCGLRRPQNFSQLVGDIDDDSLARIQLIYRDVDDIDLYTGAISEKPLEGGILGPTFTCLILDQFVRLKRGDRMWYENPNLPQAFSKEQLEEIRKTSLAHIICDNSDKLDYVQPYVMQRVGEGNEYTPCIAIPRPDLTKWKDADLPRIRFSDNSISVKPANTTFLLL
ncbi:hypothetical protein ILUMI_21822 [Ignelater luminosus]|uniref:Peroxidase n=1 Tax=Ignelater luminosus TaxID=2038154 RepID=A0A8K0CH08_IGNLU|nr:hypothetical protein ILUMI_21822 [Ignelater luminosus]